MEKPALFNGKQLHFCSPSRIVDFKFDWTIENFKFHLEKDSGSIVSPVGHTADKKYSWKLRLHFNGDRDDSKGYISLYLVYVGSNKGISKVKMSFLNCPSLEKYNFVMKSGENDMGYSKFVSKATLAKDPGFISNDHLSILCEIQVLEELSVQSRDGFTNSHKNTIHEDFYSLLTKKDLCDTTLLVDKQEFKVHKLILSARSPVFAAMFSHDFEETQTNIIKILDVSPTIMEEVIQYIYTDKFPRLHELVEDVLPFAEKYALLGLKDMCIEILDSQLTIDTAAHILLLADLYNAASFKESIIEFIAMNYRGVSATSSWIEMNTNKHPLIAEISLKLFSKLEISEKSDN